MTQPPRSDVPIEIATRITSAADQLYEENGKTAFPNVDNVRRRARVNMNDASTIMRAWRHEKTVAATPPPSPVPEPVHSAGQTLLAAVWTAALDSATTGLKMAQAGWEHERAEAEACRHQLASAFDAQNEELAQCQRRGSVLEQQLAAQAEALQAKAARIEDLMTRALEAEGQAAAATARSREIAKGADDLRTELSRAHASLDQQRQDASNRLERSEATINTLREELRQLATPDREREQCARVHAQPGLPGDAAPVPAAPHFTPPTPSTPSTPSEPAQQGAPGKPKSPNGA